MTCGKELLPHDMGAGALPTELNPNPILWHFNPNQVLVFKVMDSMPNGQDFIQD